MYLTRQPRGSHPFVESLDKSAFLIEYGGVAQLGERTVRIRKVKGSNPSVSTKRDKQAETSLFVSFYPTNKWINAALERIFKKIRSIFHTKSKYQTVSGEYKAQI